MSAIEKSNENEFDNTGDRNRTLEDFFEELSDDDSVEKFFFVKELVENVFNNCKEQL